MDIQRSGMELVRTLHTCIKIALSTFLAWLLLDQTIRMAELGSVLPEHYSKQNDQRQSAPYIEFKGAPGRLDHDRYGYRWVPETVDDEALRISFFGGSTGYQGEPPIPTLLQDKLSKKLGMPVQVANFSVVSSNHRQHLHNIIESRDIYEPDIVIFYGGYNETLQTAYYDPRPGYPYNFYYRDETHPLRQLLIRYSPTFYMLEELLTKHNMGGITCLNRLRHAEMPLSDHWNKRVIENYMDTLELAGNVTHAFASEKCSRGTFFFFYQPYQVPANFQFTHSSVRKMIAASIYGHDISDTFEKYGMTASNIYTDIVHVTQEGRNSVAEEMAEKLIGDNRFLACLNRASDKVAELQK